MKIQISVCVLLLGVSVFAAAEELPMQKPGLWQITMTSAKTPGGSRTFKMCQDSASLAAGKASADAHLKSDCSKSSIRKEGDIWIAENECTFSGMHVVSHSETTVHGDDSFHTQSKSSYGTGSPELTTIDQKYIGACEAGQKAGVPLVGK
jgi:Protein of unknown function (DUF3617)